MSSSTAKPQERQQPSRRHNSEAAAAAGHQVQLSTGGAETLTATIHTRLRQLFIALFTLNEICFLFTALLMLILETGIVHLIIQRVPYTEIDWRTYMQQVSVYMKGERNYSRITGDTGPIVYPAAHLYIYRILYVFTEKGENIRRAQYLFGAFYLVNLLLIFRLFYCSKKIPPFVLCLICLCSYRIHSIFILRLFNDPIAMTLFFAAVNLFVSRHWFIGCAFYSLAVGVKMNILLFAPALFFILLLTNDVYETSWLLSLCACIQLFISIQFLTFDKWAYLSRAFELNRVFLFKWTVNWRFLDPALFLDVRFHLFLLLCHIGMLCLMAVRIWFREHGGLIDLLKRLKYGIRIRLDTHDILLALFTSNLAGIAFARSLHYQFYCWYYYTIPYLLFSPLYAADDDVYYKRKEEEEGMAESWRKGAAKIPPFKEILFRLTIIFGVELCWNTYPSTTYSSLLLHCLHFTIIYLVFKDQRKRQKFVEQTRKRLISN